MSARTLRIFAFVLPAALALGQAAPTFGKLSPAQSAEYILGSGDLLSITIYGDPDLSRDQRIGAEGSIYMPYLKEKIKAAGKTIEQLQNAIGEAYIAQGILKTPQPIIAVKEYHSAPVNLVGSFTQPGVIQIVGRTTLLEAISQGHGLVPTAGPRIIVTRHEAGGQTQTFVVPIKDLYEKSDDPALNIELKVGDVISVPRSEFIYVVGAVNKQGTLSMNEIPDWTVLKALSAVGNVTRTAKADQTFILRKNAAGASQEIPVNLKRLLARKDPDIPLMANDMLLVPDSAGKKALLKVADMMTGLGTTGVAVLATH